MRMHACTHTHTHTHTSMHTHTNFKKSTTKITPLWFIFSMAKARLRIPNSKANPFTCETRASWPTLTPTSAQRTRITAHSNPRSWRRTPRRTIPPTGSVRSTPKPGDTVWNTSECVGFTVLQFYTSFFSFVLFCSVFSSYGMHLSDIQWLCQFLIKINVSYVKDLAEKVFVCFYPSLCQFWVKIITVINRVCACIRTSAEDDNFPREGRGMCVPNDLIWEFLCFGLSDITLFQVILGLLGISVRSML